MVCTVFEEPVIFRPKLDWTGLLRVNRSKLPVGTAVPMPSLIGWAGARGGMHEVYYVGPLAIAPGLAGVGV